MTVALTGEKDLNFLGNLLFPQELSVEEIDDAVLRFS